MDFNKSIKIKKGYTRAMRVFLLSIHFLLCCARTHATHQPFPTRPAKVKKQDPPRTLPRTLVTFKCKKVARSNSPEDTNPLSLVDCSKKTSFITSFPRRAEDLQKYFADINARLIPLKIWITAVTDVGDNFFQSDLQQHCSEEEGEDCTHAEAISVVDIQTSWDGITQIAAAETTAAENGIIEIPVITPPFDTVAVAAFPVVDDSFSVFGLSNRKTKHHEAASKSCLIFRELTQKVFIKLKMNLLAFFNPLGSFVLYRKLEDKATRSIMGNPILADFLITFAHHLINENDQIEEVSIRRGLWNKFVHYTDTEPLDEKKLDLAIGMVHRTLESVKLIADSKQVSAMSKGKNARKKMVTARKLGNVGLFIGAAGAAGVIAVAVAAAPVTFIAGAAAGVAAAGVVASSAIVEAAVAVTATTVVALQKPLKLAKIPVKVWKDRLALDKKDASDEFGKTQNQLRWVKDMLKWSEVFLEPDPLNILIEAHPRYRIKPEIMCAKFLSMPNPKACNPTSSPGMIDDWQRDALKEDRKLYKEQFLTTFIQCEFDFERCCYLVFSSTNY